MTMQVDLWRSPDISKHTPGKVHAVVHILTPGPLAPEGRYRSFCGQWPSHPQHLAPQPSEVRTGAVEEITCGSCLRALGLRSLLR